MSFMQPEVYHGHFQVIRNTSDGDIVTPEEYAEYRSNEKAAEVYGVALDDVETVFGWGYRMSAPGYLDATEWGIADTEAEAYSELLDQYGTDGGEREEWELEALSIILADCPVAERAKLAEYHGVRIDDDGNVIDIHADDE